MWIYWVTLGSVSAILYFPNKRLFSKKIALTSSVAIFVLGALYPLLQTKLFLWQVLLIFGCIITALAVYFGNLQQPDNTSQTAEDKTVTVSGKPEKSPAPLDEPEIGTEEQPEFHQYIDKAVLPDLAVSDTNPELLTSGTTKPGEVNPNAITMEQLTVTEPVQIEEVAATAEVIPEQTPIEDESTEEELVEESVKKLEEELAEEALSEEVLAEADLTDDLLIQANLTEEVPLHADVTQEVVSEEDLPEEIPVEGELTQEAFVEPSPQDLLAEGLRQVRLKNYPEAVRHFNQVVTSTTEPELIYMAVSKLSSVYQHLGLYPLAAQIIKAFMEQPDLKNHPGMNHLEQKMRFIYCLTELLDSHRLGHIPYDQVPESVRREAFINSLK
ncbi:hypothetical protein Desca_0857 [Desulfotomaculum nigrificans CO-1-SRB]|uniref:Uncharacterized protein n=1 Tax=Desulfotomaculum nigrificans (strain DSM 14880 / VKM B-2319 / CO-1-SRB) TaxID=868595 RepID=F6B9G1_DESCC|nr:tetratricopeptide repeat protein [Desulfotomaculum nigrificans]AEF93737.1 hypothetical protein Desca_0857 [Desulfotomaculum nigrificans CO-1-SRB]